MPILNIYPSKKGTVTLSVCNFVPRSVHLCQEMLHSVDSVCFKAALGLYSCTDTTEVNYTCLDNVISDYVTLTFHNTRKLESKDIHNY